ncbi:sensor domain-containing protein [Desulfosporosinus youngiae]|uniref:Diguanylate cyclase (GGDEF) domain-containing protein n=1 Tax=Desulfosporosinus youngiae DSM 17734 TaxID=768710 RepID=H5Y136_9FIRM|nr:sensor domain-containing diguanylate cyclase [Desulfosporosinus youngiae]EHQ87256.1 diguanylate cyclase (GGDEF) domain-containing protein [Desulfosporosinus youngiae DSM 17734]
MEYGPLIVSLLFFIVFAVYLFFGIYIMHLNSKASLNKSFLTVCISLCLWSFGFSIANSASNPEICLFWIRVSAVFTLIPILAIYHSIKRYGLIHQEKMISELSFDFVSVSQANFPEKANHLLSTMGQFFQVDHTYVFLFNHENNTMTYTHEWCNQGIEPEIDKVQDVPLSMFPWWIEQLKNNKLVCIEDVSQLPAEAGTEKEQFNRQKVKSLVSIPIAGNENVQGFLGVDTVMSFRKWSADHIKLLKILANLLADGLIKIKAEKEIEFLAYYDHLTGLPNRTLFADRLSQAIYLAKRSGRFVGVMFIDLDSFKTVNDTMGHNGGDMLIKEVAQRLVQRLRKTDTVARFGGDEFLIMINDIPEAKDIARIAGGIMALFESPFNLSGQEFFITGSAGVAIYPADGENAGTLTQSADIAMYKAKAKGKNRYVLYTENIRDEVRQNMIRSNSLYRTQERKELTVYCQPQV